LCFVATLEAALPTVITVNALPVAGIPNRHSLHLTAKVAQLIYGILETETLALHQMIFTPMRNPAPIIIA
jgi:hypothetical protein